MVFPETLLTYGKLFLFSTLRKKVISINSKILCQDIWGRKKVKNISALDVKLYLTLITKYNNNNWEFHY